VYEAPFSSDVDEKGFLFFYEDRVQGGMSVINYDNKRFIFLVKTDNGFTQGETIFYYRQIGDVVWGTYEGGTIKMGTFTAKVSPSGVLDLRYAHVNTNGELMTGVSISTPEVLPDGRIRLHEDFQWTSGDLSKGFSMVEELRAE
jgi:hypothetical protein